MPLGKPGVTPQGFEYAIERALKTRLTTPARLTCAISARRAFYFHSGALPQAKIEAAPSAL
jgi:hypothetical protein